MDSIHFQQKRRRGSQFEVIIFLVEGTGQPLSSSLIIKFYDVIFLDDSEETGECKLTQCTAY